jgi:hypothetical protein
MFMKKNRTILVRIDVKIYEYFNVFWFIYRGEIDWVSFIMNAEVVIVVKKYETLKEERLKSEK